LVISTLVVIALAVGIASLLTWRIKPYHFHTLGWEPFAVASSLFWGILGSVLEVVYWKTYYSYFAPSWAPLTIPLIFILYLFIGIVLRWLALKLPGNPVINFCILGGIESIPEHTLAIYKHGILKIPMFYEITAGEIYLFAFFEYVVFWGIVTGLAAIISFAWHSGILKMKGQIDNNENTNAQRK
jgi:hypothetical protein